MLSLTILMAKVDDSIVGILSYGPQRSHPSSMLHHLTTNGCVQVPQAAMVILQGRREGLKSTFEAFG